MKRKASKAIPVAEIVTGMERARAEFRDLDAALHYFVGWMFGVLKNYATEEDLRAFAVAASAEHLLEGLGK